MTEQKYVKELLSTATGTEGSLLIPKKIHATLIQDMAKALIPRSEAAIYIGPGQIPGSSYDIDLEAENAMAVRVVAEGAEIWLDQDGYSSFNMKPLKYGVAIKITKELMEDSQFPLLQRNISKAGVRFADNETNLVITQLDNATNTVAGGAAITVANITRAIQYLHDSDYEPTTLLIGNEVLNDLQNIDLFVEASKMGNTEMMQRGFVGTIYGLNVLNFSTNAAPSTTYSKYAYVYDKGNAYAIAEKRPVTVENFNLPNYDMQGAAITQRIAVHYVRANAIAKITTS